MVKTELFVKLMVLETKKICNIKLVTLLKVEKIELKTEK